MYEEVHIARLGHSASRDRVYTFDGTVLEVFGVTADGSRRFHVAQLTIDTRTLPVPDRTELSLRVPNGGITDVLSGDELVQLAPLLQRAEEASKKVR